MDLLVLYALQFVGTPYRWGGDDPMDGFDCSGYTQEILKAFGAAPPGDLTAQGLYDFFKDKSTDGMAKAGSLIFFGKGVKAISHIGILVSPELMLEAGGGGSTTVNRQEAARANAYIRLRPWARRIDMVDILNPQYRISRIIAAPSK